MATLLNKTKSDIGSPYVYYQLDYTTSNRTASTIDINVTCYSNLASSSSSLGTGSSYGIHGYLNINGNDYSWVIKPTNEKWSGTTIHTSTHTITASVSSVDTSITGISFMAIRTNGSTSNAGYLNWTGCYDVTFESFHTPPLVSGYTLTETNNTLVNANVGNNVFVSNLSKKQFNITYSLYDGASFERASVYNGTSYTYLSNSLPMTIDFTQNPLRIDEDGIPIMVRVTDNQGGATYYTTGGQGYDYYSYILYSKPTIVGSTKRVGQISGQVSVSCNGTFFNGSIGNVNQGGSYKPTITYSYYEYPSGTIKTGTISSSSITISNNTFSVSNYNIGSTNPSATNYFDPEKSYRITINVADNFTNTNSNELIIRVGEATWTEYKDRVDFKKITINGIEPPKIKELYSNSTGSTSVDIGESSSNYGMYIISWGIDYSEKRTDVFIPNFDGIDLTQFATRDYNFVYTFSNSGNYISMTYKQGSGWAQNGKMYKIIGIKF